jgi:CDP-diacylglycerol--glycerol-3-phosphate 3-phosphatidyltransferase
MKHLPNLISGCRLATAPVLLVLAWYSYPHTFLVITAASFASDVLDGTLARRLGHTSALGAKLDSLSDFVLYLTLPLGAWWLWPAIVRRESPFFLTVLACCVLPPLVAFGKFHGMTSYHTWGVKLAALAVGGSAMVLFAGGPPWLFHLAVPVSVLAAVEEIAITLVLREPQANVHSLWHVRHAIRRKVAQARDHH